jgi:tetratricopeptide (TPR) repeat protein
VWVEVGIGDGSLLDADEGAGVATAIALADAEASGDPAALAHAWSMHGARAYMDGRFADATTEWGAALDYARRSGDVRHALEQEMNLLVLAVVGTTPAAEVVAHGEELLRRLDDYPSLRADALRLVAPMEAMLERFDEALAHAEASVSVLRELDRPSELINAMGDQSWVLRLAGDLAAAEEVLRVGFDLAIAGRDRTARGWVAGRLAQLLVEEGRLAEAEAFVAEAEQVPIVMNRSRVVGARAQLMADAGDPAADAALERLLEMLEDIPFPNIKIDGFIDAAMVAVARGRPDEALVHAEEALRLAKAKGNIARARQIEALIERIGEGRAAR